MRLLSSISGLLVLILSSPSILWSQDAVSGSSLAPSAYIEQALDIMQRNALHKKEIDWESVRRETLARCKNAKAISDAYPAIAYALSQLRERHSFLQLPDSMPPEQKRATYEQMWQGVGSPVPSWKMSPFALSEQIQAKMLHRDGNSYAYVVVPMCAAKYAEWSKNGPMFQDFADRLHKVVIDLDAQKPTGWIIDLRGNGGGNMWPMLAGIRAVLGEGSLGAFVSADGARTSWQYKNGKAGGALHTEAEIKEDPFVLSDLPPVAVLFDRGTASSGEAVAISFAGRPREHSFGEHTAGFSTSNQRYPLPDGAALFLCVGTEADRTGRLYPDGLDPDTAVQEPDLRPPNENEDAGIEAAEKWLLGQDVAPRNANPIR